MAHAHTQTVVITGAGGFVGNYLVDELLASSFAEKIIGLDTAVDTMPNTIERHVIDITKSESFTAIIRDAQPAWIVHLAAVASIPFAIEHPDLTRAINVFGTKNILDVAQEVSPHTKFLIISSADIYGKVGHDPLSELPLFHCHPANPYAQSKFEMEELIERQYNGQCIRVRPFPHIGPKQRQGFVVADFASQIAHIESGVQEPVISVGNLEAIRDFTDVRDVVRAYRLLMQVGELGQVYNVASGSGVHIQQVLDILLALATVPIHVSQDAARMRPSDNPVMIGSTEKLHTATAWKPAIALQQSLEDILEYWRAKS